MLEIWHDLLSLKCFDRGKCVFCFHYLQQKRLLLLCAMDGSALSDDCAELLVDRCRTDR